MIYTKLLLIVVLFAGASIAQKIDIDLTKLNPMMTYAQVSNMMSKPQGFVGKTVKARGSYDAWPHPGTGRHHHFIVVSDAPGCCPAGLEFWRGDKFKYPNDYPPLGVNIEVVGVFKSYVHNDHTYYYLAVDGGVAVVK